MVSVLMMAFVMVVASALLLIPLMLYGLDLQSRGWTAAHVALFGAMIASTDAASVSAALRSGAQWQIDGLDSGIEGVWQSVLWTAHARSFGGCPSDTLHRQDLAVDPGTRSCKQRPP